jgi:hypothetical protein
MFKKAALEPSGISAMQLPMNQERAMAWVGMCI